MYAWYLRHLIFFPTDNKIVESLLTKQLKEFKPKPIARLLQDLNAVLREYASITFVLTAGRYLQVARGYQLIIDVAQLYSVCINIIRRNLVEPELASVAMRLVETLPAVAGIISQQHEVPIDDFALQMLVGFHTLPADAVAELVEVFRTCFLPSNPGTKQGMVLFPSLLQVCVFNIQWFVLCVLLLLLVSVAHRC